MIKITLAQAKEVMAERANGSVDGISPGKGGRAWRRARELARLTAELRNITRGHVYNYAREARIVRRIGELTR